eukprot:GHRR01037189.1.p1 GENE.GHRR01037189.1~~GHRR01037189.1.p1  ORF type:complete len:142 (-),score=29.94 GHRR01037189.1:94-519(-)
MCQHTQQPLQHFSHCWPVLCLACPARLCQLDISRWQGGGRTSSRPWVRAQVLGHNFVDDFAMMKAGKGKRTSHKLPHCMDKAAVVSSLLSLKPQNTGMLSSIHAADSVIMSLHCMSHSVNHSSASCICGFLTKCFTSSNPR